MISWNEKEREKKGLSLHLWLTDSRSECPSRAVPRADLRPLQHRAAHLQGVREDTGDASTDSAGRDTLYQVSE